MTVIYWCWWDVIPLFRILRFVFPPVFFLALYHSRRWFEHWAILRKFGHYSFAVYIFHPILCMAVGIVAPAYITRTIWGMAIQFVVVASISLIMAIVVDKIKFLRKILFPRGEDIAVLNKLK